MDHLKPHTPTRFSVLSRASDDGEPGDPQELSFEIGRHGHPPTKYLLSNGGIKRSGDPGKFHVDLVLKQPGTWSYRWKAFGATVTEAEEVHFVIDTIKFL